MALNPDPYYRDPEIEKLNLAEEGSLAAIDRFNEVLSKIKGNSPADKGKRAAVEDDIARAKKKGNKKEVEKLKEARGKKVTQAMWKKMNIDQRVDALLTIIEDPDRAEKFIEKKWNQLPNDRNFMTTESALKALKEFRTFYKK